VLLDVISGEISMVVRSGRASVPEIFDDGNTHENYDLLVRLDVLLKFAYHPMATIQMPAHWERAVLSALILAAV